MSHIIGLFLIDAPASALNNAGKVEGLRNDNTVAVKYIPTSKGNYPYVSAQAFRYWLRETLANTVSNDWTESPVFRETKIAYTDADPIAFCDDDLFGYMRAESKKVKAEKKEKGDEMVNGTPTDRAITRVSPFKVGTLVSIAPVSIVDDYGTMTRQEGDPVPHEHQFYKATLQAPFALDLYNAGTFWASKRTGFANLDTVRIEKAKEMKLEEVKNRSGVTGYRLKTEERVKRVQTLLKGLSLIEGGAKLTLHYTDVTPSFVIMAVTRGGNNIFSRVIKANKSGNPEVNLDVLEEILDDYKDDIISRLYIGLPQGYMDEHRNKLQDKLEEILSGNYFFGSPKKAFAELINDIENNKEWME